MKICFVPHIECGNRFRYDNTYFFDDFMISLNIKIIKYFSKFEKIDFIIKALKGSTYAEILNDHIKNQNYSNIFFVDGNLMDSLKESDLAIIDFPSSSILDANEANIPTLVLSYKNIKIREKALLQFNNVEIFRYDDQMEVLRKISDFINMYKN